MLCIFVPDINSNKGKMRALRLAIVVQIILMITPLMMRAQSRQVIIEGTVIDSKDGNSLPGATILDLDTNVGTITNADGRFKLQVPTSDDQFKLQISYIGYEPVAKSFSTSLRLYSLGDIALSEEVQNISEVVVKGQVPTAKLKGDTVSFNASSVKVSKDSKGIRLLKKLPGFTVEKGKIETQGEQVKKVYLNGKPFFEDDPQNAFNALPADVIKNIEVFDDYGEIAKFTGYSSGNSVKAINIVTTPEFANSITSMTSVGYGTNGRFAAEGSTTHNTDKHTLTVVLDGNNINKSNSELNDFKSFEQMVAAKITGGTQKEPESFGEREYKSVGLNYNVDLSDRTELSLNYVYGTIDNKLNQDIVQNYQDTWYYSMIDSTRQESNLNKIRLRLSYEPSDKNKWIFNQQNILMNGEDSYNNSTLGHTRDIPVNFSNTNNILTKDRFQSSTTAIWLHNFNKQGRSLATIGKLTLNDNTQEQDLASIVGKYQVLPNNELDSLMSVQEYQYDIENQNNSAMLRVAWKEPVGMLSSLNIIAKSTYNWRESDKQSLSFESLSHDFVGRPDLSNDLSSDYWTNSLSLGVSKIGLKAVVNLGIGYEQIILNNNSNEEEEASRSYYNLVPLLFGKLFISSEQNLVFAGSSKALVPTVQQLQETVDLSNPLKVVAGNSELKPGLQHILMGRYTYARSETSKFLSAYGFFRYSNDFVGWETYMTNSPETLYGYELMKGVQVSKPVNLDGMLQVLGGIDYSLPIRPMRCNLNLGGRYSYSEMPTIYQGINLTGYNSMYGVRVGLASNISEKVDFNIISNTSYNRTRNSENDNYSEYIKQKLEADLNLVFLKRYNLSAEYKYTLYDYLGENQNQENNLLNLSIGRSFLKDNKAKVSLSMYDVLDQNKGLDYNLHETYNERIKSDALGQYVMVSFQLKF
ncbi:TonB-dependent receptor [Puteibacter caeruleilacunae]|nr:TonB-dependent receptor [Puteibacter caeruleilacunae]